MPKELEKLRDWEKEFDEEFKYLGEDEYDLTRKGIKSFIQKLFQERDKLLVARIEALDYRDFEKGEKFITKEEAIAIINNIEPK